MEPNLYIAFFKSGTRTERLIVGASNLTDARTNAQTLVEETDRGDWTFLNVVPIRGYFIDGESVVPIQHSHEASA